jgi:hypothetical protein
MESIKVIIINHHSLKDKQTVQVCPMHQGTPNQPHHKSQLFLPFYRFVAVVPVVTNTVLLLKFRTNLT